MNTTDEKGRVVSIHCWKHMHVKDARWLDLTIIQVIRPHASDKERDPRISWFVYIGQDPPEGFAQIACCIIYVLVRNMGTDFDKQALLWTKPRCALQNNSIVGVTSCDRAQSVWCLHMIWSREVLVYQICTHVS